MIQYETCRKYFSCYVRVVVEFVEYTGNRYIYIYTRVFPQIYLYLRFKITEQLVTERDKGNLFHYTNIPPPRSNYLAAISHRYSRPVTRARFSPPAVFTLGTWFPYLTSVHIRIIQGGFLKIDEKAGAPRETRLYPDPASGIHDAPSRMGGRGGSPVGVIQRGGGGRKKG